MASLREDSALLPRRPTRWLQISPVAPSMDGPRDAYLISFGPSESGRTVEINCCVYGFQLNHSYFEEFADAFIDAAALRDHRFQGNARRNLSITDSIDWMYVVITDIGARKVPDQVAIHLFYSQQERELKIEQYDYKLFRMVSTGQEARRFGEELMEEIAQARLERKRLGLLTDEEKGLLEDEAEER